MSIGRFKTWLGVMVTCVALAGCSGGGGGFVEPDPSPPVVGGQADVDADSTVDQPTSAEEEEMPAP